MRPISGWDGVEVNISSKNIYDPSKIRSRGHDDWDAIMGGQKQKFGINAWPRWTCIISAIPGATYYWTTPCYDVGFLDAEENVLTYKTGWNYSSIVAPANAVYIYHTWIRNATMTAEELMAMHNTMDLYIGSIPSQFESHYGTTHNLNWSNDIGTVYGGYVDLVTGELVQEYSDIIVTSNIITQCDIISKNVNLTLNVSLIRNFTGSNWRTKQYINCWDSQNNTSLSNAIYYNFSPDNTPYIVIGRYFLSELTEENAYTFLDTLENNGTPLHIVFPLETPIAYALTPTQLQTLLGHNNIWSNADRVEVEYDLAETNDELYRRRNIILRSAPHIVTPEPAALQHFSTDVAAPLKKCKIHFSPVQTGSGDPSPENVREISGWDKLEITRSGRNVFNINKLQGKNIAIENGIATATGGWFHNNFGTITSPVPLDIDFGNSRWTLRMMTYTNGEQASEHSVGLYIYFDYMDGTRNAYACYNDETIFTEHVFTSLANRNLKQIRFSYSQRGNNIWHIKDIHLEPMDTYINYEPYNGINIPISWENDIGTVYGGYIDLISGQIIATYYYFTPNSNTNVYTYGSNDYNGTYFSNRCVELPIASCITHPTQQKNILLFCNKINCYHNNYSWYKADECMWQAAINAKIQLHISLNNNAIGYDPTTESFASGSNKARNWLAENNLHFAIPLETPQYLGTLSSTQLSTLRGQNNIWSNSNGPIELSYWTH